MFTGIIEETGKILSVEKLSQGQKITIECSIVMSDLKMGDSVCVDGVCTTVCEYGENWFKVDISNETLGVTTFSSLNIGQVVNLERALTPASRIGGHIVSGHIDGTAKIVSVKKMADFYDISIEIPINLAKYVVYKGSITINGISLTVAEISGAMVKIAVIPHTFHNTSFQYICEGDIVNVETDILARYVEKLLLLNDNDKKSNIDTTFLKENGFM